MGCGEDCGEKVIWGGARELAEVEMVEGFCEEGSEV